MRTDQALFFAVACTLLFSPASQSDLPGTAVDANETAGAPDVLLRGPLGGSTGSNGQASDNGLRAPIENIQIPENKWRGSRQILDSDTAEINDKAVKQQDTGKHKTITSTVGDVEKLNVKAAKSGAGLTGKAAKTGIGLPFKAAKELMKAITP